MKEIIFEPQRKISVRGKFDIVVAGGGPAGIAAALAVKDNVQPRKVDIKKFQKILKDHGVAL